MIRRTRAEDPDRLRLCMFSQDHGASKMGGIGRWTNLVARGLAERGHEVTVMGHLRVAQDPEQPKPARRPPAICRFHPAQLLEPQPRQFRARG